MTLSQAQCKFASGLALLISKAQEMGYSVKIVTYLRSLADEQSEIAAGKSHLKDPSHSKHVQGLAVDLALFKNEILTENGEDYRVLGEYWESLGGRWGGRFGLENEPKEVQNSKIGWDFDHFEALYT